MTTLTGLAKLQAANTVFQFRNRTNAAQTIQLEGGDAVQVQPGAIGKVLSSGLTQLPEFKSFMPIVPSIQELIDAGLIGQTEEASAVPAKPADPEPEEPEQSGGQSLSKTRK